MGSSVAASKSPLPHELRSKVPPLVVMFLEQRIFWTLFGLALALFSLYGPIAGPHAHDYNGYRYLLAPWVCPWVPAISYIIFPPNPYRGYPASFAGMVELDQRDPDAKRLAELFRSPEARHVLVRTTLKISAVLFVVMALVTVAVRDSLTWSFSSYWLIPGLLGGAIGSLGALRSQVISWGLRNWAASYRRGDQPSA